jgi:hypothetical protein
MKMLEQKIEELTQAVNKLIEALNSDKQAVQVQDNVENIAPATEEPKPKKPKAKKTDPIVAVASGGNDVLPSVQEVNPVASQPEEIVTEVDLSDGALITACSTAVRKNPDNRAKIKEHMATYKVSRVGELAKEVRADFLAFVEGL